MVCPRCVRVVREDLENVGIEVEEVELGKAIISGSFDKSQVREILINAGFDLVEDKEEQQVEVIKTLIIDLIDQDYFQNHHLTNSALIEDYVNVPYDKLSRIFSANTGITIEQFIIQQKISKVKEYLKYSQHTLEHIAYLLGYSSSAHLSGQFKTITGLTPSQFRSEFKISR